MEKFVTPSAPHIYIENAAAWDGQEVTLKGWVYNTRSSGKIRFVIVRDGTGIMQCVGSINDIGDAGFEAVDRLSQESSVMVVGTVRKEPRAPGGFEMTLKQVVPVHVALGEFPISPKEHGTAFLMDNRHLWLRSKRQVSIMRVRHTIVKAIRDFFDGRGFTLFDPPIFTNAACEGTSTLFETDYFGEKAYLSQSGQLYGECGAMALGKIYTFGPTFRAEKSKTRRHLTEFWMIEPEVAYMDMWGAAELAEDMICFIVQRILETRQEDLKVIERDPAIIERIQKPFPRLSYTDAIDVLKKGGHEIEWGGDIGGDEETTISNQHDRPVILYHFPADLKAFYMKRDPADPKLALGFDVLAPEGKGEVIGGGQREDDYDTLCGRIKEHGLNIEDFEWFLDLRKYGTVPHAGFGLGLERTVAWMCGLPHVRETIPFPRMISRLKP
ncbi:MAG: asparagine--tRNA ligase [bacterium]|nr:asparagine--tRNA ligase [bacterium]MBK8130486.1 asparagine--tRNA ligase [bacterium]